MRPSFKSMVDAEAIIETDVYKQLWLDHLKERQQILWEGVGYDFPSLLQMWFAEIDYNVPILSASNHIDVTVLRCGKQKWAYYDVDGDNQLYLNIDHCNCASQCEWYNECRGLRLDEVTIP